MRKSIAMLRRAIEEKEKEKAMIAETAVEKATMREILRK